MNFLNLDLNLLVSLNALLEERSVTRAATRLGLSQPALSASLARLRRHFGDELLIRVGNHYELTPLAIQLQARSMVALGGVERVFATQALFDPTTSQRTFTVLSSDYAMAVLAGPVCDIVARQAPHVRMRFDPHSPEIVARGPDALRGVDGMLLPHGFMSDLPNQDVFTDDWVCLVSAGNTQVGDALTLAQLGSLAWVFTYHAPAAFAPAARQLQLLGIEPIVAAVVGSFLAMPHLVTRSNRVALVQRRLAEELPMPTDVRILECPYDAVPLTEALWWHPMYERDPEHQWLRWVFAEAARRLGPQPGSR